MLKITQHLNNANLYLIRKHNIISNRTCAAVLVMRTPARHYAKDYFAGQECPPPKKRTPKSLYGLIGAAILAGSAIVYAKHSPETRNWLQNNFPIGNSIIAIVYQEEESYWDFTTDKLERAKQGVTDFIFGQEGITPNECEVRSDQNLEEEAKKKYKENKAYQLPPLTLEPLYVEEPVLETPEVDTPSTLVQTEKCEPEEKLTINITKPLVELEADMHTNTKIAVDAYKEALKPCIDFNKALTRVIELPIEVLEKKHFTAVSAHRSARDNLAKKAREAKKTATEAIDALERSIDEGLEAPPDVIAVTRRYIATFRKDLAAAENAYKAEYEKTVMSDRFPEEVKKARLKYKEELEALFPGLDLNARILNLKDNTDLLLLYTLKQIQYLQNELAELQTVRESQISQAINCGDEKALIDLKVTDMVKRCLQEKAREGQLKELQMEAEHKKKMKEELEKQMDMQQKCMAAAIAAKEREIMSAMNRQVSERVEKERVVFKKELAAMVGKLQAIEQTLKERAKAESEARQSQSMWAAAEALLATTRRAQPETDVRDEINALAKAGKNDKLVKTVLDGIPKETVEKGIVTEAALRRRFDKLEQTALKVALVGRDGASLPTYFLSWLQSKVLFNKLAEIPKDELNNQPTDFTKLDTFDIMQRARYYMDRGNLSSALRYVNLLQGAPRVAACSWLQAARSHLEVRQAAETVMAHASLVGLLHCG